MDVERIYAQYQKYIAIAERMRLRSFSTPEPVAAGSVDRLGLLDMPAPEGVALQPERRELWRPAAIQEGITRLRQARN